MVAQREPVDMMQYSLALFVAVLTLTRESAASAIPYEACEVRVRTQAGWVCGRLKYWERCAFGSFHVPYARQPTGELRFKELQPLEPWDYLYDATKAGPICPQTSRIIANLMTVKDMSEACIYANVHVPLHALRNNTCGRTEKSDAGLPILVFIYGAGFILGSGETDLYGPEYLMKKGVIVITFNYRINIFGFLSLNSPSVPGNNGLRDAVTLLKWVQANARNFGGNPDEVTLGGLSSGAASAHLLTWSKAATGLFKRAIMMSGVGVRSFFATSPEHARQIANALISYLGINATDPEEIHQQLTTMPLEILMNATSKVQSEYRFNSFTPVVEKSFSKYTTIINEDPEVSLSQGKGNNISLIIGFNNCEESFYIPSFREIKVLEKIEKNPLKMMPPNLLEKLPKEKALEIAKQIKNRYFNGTPTVERYGKFYRDSSFVYPALKLAQIRASTKSAPVYLYHFKYNPDFSFIKATKNVQYQGATHTDDLQFVFRTNSFKAIKEFEHPTRRDVKMRERMTSFFANFMTCNDPTCGDKSSLTWPAGTAQWPLRYTKITNPDEIFYEQITKDQQDTYQYFDSIYNEI